MIAQTQDDAKVGRPLSNPPDNSWPSRFALELRRRRQAAGLSQKEFAELLREKEGLNYEQPAVSAWEIAKRLPAIPVLESIARVLQCEPADLMPPLKQSRRSR